MSQPNETTTNRAQRNSQPRTTATTSSAATVPPTSRATATNRRSMQPPAPTNPDPGPSVTARSGPQARSPATTRRGSRAATGGPSNPVARPRERQMMSMLQKFQNCLNLAQRKMLEQMCRRKSTSPPLTPTPPPALAAAAAPLQLLPQSAMVQLSAPPHIREMSGKEYAEASRMRSAAVHNPLLVSRALETVVNQQGPSRGGATNNSSTGGGANKKKRGGGEDDDEEENVIVLDNENELQGSSTEVGTKKRKVMSCSKNKSAACSDDAVATELPLQMIIPNPNSSHAEEEEEEKNTTTVEGFLYRDEDEQGCIISCNCHGMIFLTPADFIKHAGGSADALNPIKRISITVTHLP